MKNYNQDVIEYIEAQQRISLIKKFGLEFENKFPDIINYNDQFLDFIENQLEVEFRDNYDSRFELEALLKGEALKDIQNLTKYEFPLHKKLLNFAENIFLNVIDGNFEEDIPYTATLFSDKVEAEIIYFESLDKPIIFFHGELFVANLLLSKLYILLMPIEFSSDSKIFRFHTEKKSIDAKIENVKPKADDFFNRFFSHKFTNTNNSSYSLNSESENVILYLFLESLSLFIFSHEIAHSSYSHFSIKEKTIEEKWHDEFEADLYATNRVVELYRKNVNPNPFTLIAPIIFFKYLILVEKYNSEISQENSHPPTQKRLENYYIHLVNLTKEDEEEIINNYLTLEQNISLVLLKHFEDIKNKK